jgi:dTDP-4-amino-4,6-dideoxygalactose transaminase
VTIPFNRPTSTRNDAKYLEAALAAGHLSGDGAFTSRCEREIEAITGSHRAMLTTSCTHALEISAFLLDIRPGDEVIVPSFTFVSTVNAYVIRGATPVFADVRPDTLGIDVSHVQRLVSERTRAIVPVHYGGVACDMGALCRIAERTGAAVVEDNAHGLFASYEGRALGSFGSMAALSFHATKNVTCGEGGALLLNEARLVERAEIVREKGTDRRKFIRGEIDKYGWVDVGSSYLPSELLAAMLCAQLEERASIQRRRQAIWDRYAAALRPWAESGNITLPTVPAACNQSFHMFYLLMPSADSKHRLLNHLKANGISAASHYLPLNTSMMGQRFGGRPGQCPVSEHLATVLIRLPFYTSLTPEDQQTVIDALYAFEPAVV